MGESQLIPTAAGGKAASCTTLAYLSLHPIGTAVVGGILIGLGAYYLGKNISNRKNKAPKEESDAEPIVA